MGGGGGLIGVGRDAGVVEKGNESGGSRRRGVEGMVAGKEGVEYGEGGVKDKRR